MMSRVGKTEGAGALHRGILEARLEKRAILPNFNVDIRDPKFLIGLRLTESNLRFRNFGFEMGFCPISQFPLLVTQVCYCPKLGGNYSSSLPMLSPNVSAWIPSFSSNGKYRFATGVSFGYRTCRPPPIAATPGVIKSTGRSL